MEANEPAKIQIKNSGMRIKKIGKMPIFKCSCGANILVIPDLIEMDKAIKAHMVDHKKATGQRLEEEILMLLIIKTIIAYQS